MIHFLKIKSRIRKLFFFCHDSLNDMDIRKLKSSLVKISLITHISRFPKFYT